jgi:CheY-like chemotaxis protein/anti-sigma regulatory factor (Ser/Thr protein kinase)
VLESVVSNAIQYNRSGGHVQLHLEARQGQTVLAVEDTGRGMSAAQLTQLFDPFNRLGAQGHDVRGTGLGLVIARQLMRAMNGDIHVQSKPGVGTRVELVIPSTEADDAAPPAPEAARAETHQLILYIEDDEVNTLLMEQVLRNQPAWRMVAAATGGAGLEMARDRHPAVILLDLHLPDMSGIDVLKQLRADSRTRHIPCIAVSADAHWEHIATTNDIGFDAFWKKPIDFEQVLGGLRTLLSDRVA